VRLARGISFLKILAFQFTLIKLYCYIGSAILLCNHADFKFEYLLLTVVSRGHGKVAILIMYNLQSKLMKMPLLKMALMHLYVRTLSVLASTSKKVVQLEQQYFVVNL